MLRRIFPVKRIRVIQPVGAIESSAEVLIGFHQSSGAVVSTSASQFRHERCSESLRKRHEPCWGRRNGSHHRSGLGGGFLPASDLLARVRPVKMRGGRVDVLSFGPVVSLPDLILVLKRIESCDDGELMPG